MYDDLRFTILQCHIYLLSFQNPSSVEIKLDAFFVNLLGILSLLGAGVVQDC